MTRMVLVVTLVAVCAAPLWAQGGGPNAWEQTPSSLAGGGPDDRAYPDKVIVGPDGGEMVWVPAGEFMMGSTDAEIQYALDKLGASLKWVKNEKPAHRVTITRGFWLGKCEVTNVQYRRFRPSHDSGSFAELSLNGDDQPVVEVSWEDGKAYCSHFGLRLPTEAESEYACRARSTGKFWWGDSDTEAGKCANVPDWTLRAKLALWMPDLVVPIFDTDDGHAVTAPVGSYRANDFGLHDMLGNVFNWCADWYAENYYASSPGSDPTGPASGTARVLRGGWWLDVPCDCRSSYRYRFDPDDWVAANGFRVVVPPK